MSDRLRVGIIGAGRRGSQHAATLAELSEDFDLVAVCDPSSSAVQRHVERYGCRAYASTRELFSAEQMDFVVVTTPPELHHVSVAAAAERGVNVLCETPLGLTRGMIDVLAEAVDRAGIVVEVAENYGRRPIERLNRQAVEAGAIGELAHLSAFNAPANHESAYHMVSLLRMYAGGADVTEVQAVERRNRVDRSYSAPHPATEEAWVEAVLTFDNGIAATCSYVTTWTAPHRGGRPRIVCVEGTAGHLLSEEGGGHNRIRRIEGGQPRDVSMKVETRREGESAVPLRFGYPLDPPLAIENSFAQSIRTDTAPGTVCDGLGRATELMSLRDAIIGKTPVGCSIVDGRRSQEIGIAIIEAARVGQPISASLGSETPWERAQHEAFLRRYGADPLLGFRELM